MYSINWTRFDPSPIGGIGHMANRERNSFLPVVLSDDSEQQSAKFYLLLPVRLLIIFISLYFFICSLHLLSSSFRLLGGRAASMTFLFNLHGQPWLVKIASHSICWIIRLLRCRSDIFGRGTAAESDRGCCDRDPRYGTRPELLHIHIHHSFLGYRR